MFNRAWLAGGIPRTACVAAYEPICAVSLADSYINRANPGTLDAYAGTAPTWSESLGWTFNGSTQYLLSDITVSASHSAIIRYSGATNAAPDKIIFGSQGPSAGFNGLFLEPSRSNQLLARQGGALAVSPGLLSGVVALSGQQMYRDGAADGGAIGAGSGAFRTKIAIGALYEAVPGFYCNSNIQALYIYNVPITPTQVRAVTDAMNMLPMRPRVPAFPSWLRGAALTQFRKLLGLRTGSRGVSE